MPPPVRDPPSSRSARRSAWCTAATTMPPRADLLVDERAPPVVARPHRDWWSAHRAATATAPVSSTPASATRRRCPADNMRTERSAKGVRAGARERGIDFVARDGAANADGKLQVFARREIALERRLVSEIGQFRVKCIARLTRRRAAPGHLPFFRIQQPGDRAQQRGLAGAVLSGEQHALAGFAAKLTPRST